MTDFLTNYHIKQCSSKTESELSTNIVLTIYILLSPLWVAIGAALGSKFSVDFSSQSMVVSICIPILVYVYGSIYAYASGGVVNKAVPGVMIAFVTLIPLLLLSNPSGFLIALPLFFCIIPVWSLFGSIVNSLPWHLVFFFLPSTIPYLAAISPLTIEENMLLAAYLGTFLIPMRLFLVELFGPKRRLFLLLLYLMIAFFITLGLEKIPAISSLIELL